MNMKLLSFFLGLSFVTESAFGARNYNPQTTSAFLFLKSYPEADLNSQINKARIQEIQTQVEALFKVVLTNAGEAYFSYGLPWDVGRILIGFDDATTQLLMTKFGNAESINLITTSTGLPALDAVLKMAGCTEIRKNIMTGMPNWLTIPKEANPEAVSKIISHAKVPGITYVEPNQHIIFGGNETLYRQQIASGRSVYTFFYGWGDCPSGCTSGHFKYYELWGNQVTFIGETGLPLPAAGQRLFR